MADLRKIATSCLTQHPQMWNPDHGDIMLHGYNTKIISGEVARVLGNQPGSQQWGSVRHVSLMCVLKMGMNNCCFIAFIGRHEPQQLSCTQDQTAQLPASDLDSRRKVRQSSRCVSGFFLQTAFILCTQTQNLFPWMQHGCYFFQERISVTDSK